MATETGPKTLQQAIRYYSDLDVCQDTLVSARWPDGVECPHCGSKDVIYLQAQRRWQCRTKHPRRQFSVKVGTIFEDSPIGLDKWFAAIWLIDNAKNGISSYEIGRAIGVTQKSAWFMLHRVRLAMQTKRFTKISGEIEVDETYIGGKARNMHASKRAKLDVKRGRSLHGKTAVMGLLDRHGKDGVSQVRTEILSGLKRGVVQGHVRAHVEPGTTVNTDGLPLLHRPQRQLHAQRDRPRRAVRQRHGPHERLREFWSLLKRAIKGTSASSRSTCSATWTNRRSGSIIAKTPTRAGSQRR